MDNFYARKRVLCEGRRRVSRILYADPWFHVGLEVSRGRPRVRVSGRSFRIRTTTSVEPSLDASGTSACGAMGAVNPLFRRTFLVILEVALYHTLHIPFAR